jgi:hypothetical protein
VGGNLAPCGRAHRKTPAGKKEIGGAPVRPSLSRPPFGLHAEGFQFSSLSLGGHTFHCSRGSQFRRLELAFNIVTIQVHAFGAREPRPSRNQRHRPPWPKHLSSSTVGPRLDPDPRVSTSACHTFAESKRRIPRRPVIKRPRPAPHLFRRLILNPNVGSPTFSGPSSPDDVRRPGNIPKARTGHYHEPNVSSSLTSCGMLVAKMRPKWGQGSGHRSHWCGG